ncbi:hypothetical protein FQN53_001801 [Emmonsiellopsis sp. PD_33]|nr:hypothetical protein FQN53_001801 [Emmonsiellopsis sp. PD_33]
MPGRLLPSFVRPSAHSSSPSLPYDHSDRSTIRSSSSSSSRRSTKSAASHSGADEPPPETRERHLSFSMDSIIHLHRHKENKGKRRALARTRSGEGSSESHSAGASLDIVIESGPLVLYGRPSESTGGLMSGRLRLDVASVPGEITLKDLRMRLTSTATTKKPVSKDCTSCRSRQEEMKKWEFLAEPVHLTSGKHEFPFSFLFPGNLQATTQGSLGTVSYTLSALALTSTGELRLELPVNIKRAVKPGPDKSSMRIFPPTNLTARAVVPSVVHPIGNFTVQLALGGVVERREDTQARWRLRKLMWRIEEHQKIISPACAKHAHKVTDPKGITHQETRIIGNGEQKNGWKTDFDTAGGEINAEFEAAIRPGSNPLCNLSSLIDGGLDVKHDLVVELIVAEEFCPNHNTKLITPTGAARVLRMVFHIHVTERAGLGISWDQESPPVYGDVPASPPGYAFGDAAHDSSMENYHGLPLPLPDYEELDRMDEFERLTISSRGGPSDLSRQESREQSRLTTDDLEFEPQVDEQGAQRSDTTDDDDLIHDTAEGVLQ